MIRKTLCHAPLVAVVALGIAAPVAARPPDAAPGGSEAFARLLAMHPEAAPTPTFARQTGLACDQCHTQYPQLTALGRAFKLNGYVMRRGQTIEAKSGERTTLLVGAIPALSFMVQTSFTQTAEALPESSNGSVVLPDQLSLFLGGEITPRIGGFIQVTYDGIGGDFGLDNTDIRFADETDAFGEKLNWGISLNNNPTVQDLWNSTPAWGFPYASSAVAPAPAAAPLLDGGLGGVAAGLTAYGLWAQTLYLEGGAYRSAPTGVSRPLGVDAPGQIDGGAPYWRAALQHQWTNDYAHVGGYGLVADLLAGDPAPAGTTDRYNDVALDASWLHDFGSKNLFSLLTTWIHEKATPGFLPAAATAVDRKLDTYRLDATYFRGTWLGLTVAPFSTTGTKAPTVYAPESVDGSRTGSPDSRGIIGQLSLMPWENTKFAFQYTAYSRFNGASSNYDGSGRDASDNNTFYLVTWIIF